MNDVGEFSRVLDETTMAHSEVYHDEARPKGMALLR